MLTMLPRLREMKCFAASRAMSIVPVTLVANTASKLSRSVSTSGLNVPKPALLTSTSRCPNALMSSCVGADHVCFAGHVGADGMRAK